jgi:CRP-like cAMP-binding protein
MEINGWHLLKNGLRRFCNFSDGELDLLKPSLSARHLSKGEDFATEGKVATMVGIVLSGNLRHFYTSDGLERTTYFYFENHFISAYISCMTGKPSQLTIQAITDSELLVFPYKALTALFDQSHHWERFGRLLAEYLAIGLEERMVTLLMLSPEERYHHLLGSGKDKILERIPQHYIASYLGITPVSLSRIRNRAAGK